MWALAAFEKSCLQLCEMWQPMGCKGFNLKRVAENSAKCANQWDARDSI